MAFTCFNLTIASHVAHIELKRGEALNSMIQEFWSELPAIFTDIADDPSVRAVVISSTGRHFSAGLDLNWAKELMAPRAGDPARNREALRRHVKEMQQAFIAIDQCRVPVIAAIQGGCIGAGVDLVSACDIRIGTADSFYTIQEIAIGIVADMGTLQRLPYLLPQGLIRELAYTGRRWPASEAQATGFLNRLEPDSGKALDSAMALAQEIASKSPVGIAGIKQVLNAGRDMSIDQGLEYVATWNAAMMPGEDVQVALKAQVERAEALFANLAG